LSVAYTVGSVTIGIKNSGTLAWDNGYLIPQFKIVIVAGN